MIMMTKWLPRRAAALMAAVMVAAALAAALAHSSQAPARYGLASNGVINTDGIQGTGIVHA